MDKNKDIFSNMEGENYSDDYDFVVTSDDESKTVED